MKKNRIANNGERQGIIVKPLPPFDFDLTLGVYGSFSAQNVDLYSPGCFKRVLSMNEKKYLITVNSVGTIQNPEVIVSLYPTPQEREKRERLVERMKWMMSAELDLNPFYEYVENVDPILFQITRKLFGLKPPRTASVFEALIVAITEQQSALATASKLRGRLVKKYGDTIIVGGRVYHAFPTPRALAQARPEEIRDLGFSFRKASCIVEVAQRVDKGELNLERLMTAPQEKVVEALTQIKGIGRWTAEYVMCRGMGRYEALPADDAGLKASVSKFYRRGRGASEKDVREVLERFGKFKGCAALYLVFAYALEKYKMDPRSGRVQLKLG
jgi:DNA-3-methyladenine glycosylase II